MSDPLVFMMGEFRAEIPQDRQYAENHMWAQACEPKRLWRFGFTAYAVRLLQDVYFLDWALEAPATLELRQEIGSIESKKAESALYAPIAGQLVAFNQLLMRDPTPINTDKYGEGWLFEIEAIGDTLLSPAEYVAHLDHVWEKTQRTIKGQLNQ